MWSDATLALHQAAVHALLVFKGLGVLWLARLFQDNTVWEAEDGPQSLDRALYQRLENPRQQLDDSLSPVVDGTALQSGLEHLRKPWVEKLSACVDGRESKAEI